MNPNPYIGEDLQALAETVRRISNEESVSYLFNEDLVAPGALFLP